MNFFTDLHSRVAALSGFFPDAVTGEDLGATVQGLDAAQLLSVMTLAAEARQSLEQVSLATSAVINARSTREAGHAGLAQSLGFRTPAALIQQVSGVSRGVAMQQIRVGEALLGTDQASGPASGGVDAGGVDGGGADAGTATATGIEPFIERDADGLPVMVPVRRAPWHEPLSIAFRAGTLSTAQHDAIKQGLGEPPLTSAADAVGTAAGTGTAVSTGTTPEGGTGPHNLVANLATTPDPATVEAWSLAATQLADYAKEVSVEELAKHARAIRDLLDPDGAHQRFLTKYEKRSFRMWTDTDGLTHGKFVFDDEAAEWVRTIIDTALRPRRGGPRFVTAEEQKKAQTLQNDPRTNDQLTHDLLLDVFRAGAVADAATVFGVRQAGIKLVQVVNRNDYFAGTSGDSSSDSSSDSDSNSNTSNTSDTSNSAGARTRSNSSARPPVTRYQESGITLPAGMGEKHRCNTGTQPVIVDEYGDPLNVGREARLFTTKQRVALAIRDGGCRWSGCDRPASYCEAHHIDHWDADHGHTNIDRGVLLCRYHHMQLHNNKWKITRNERGPFLLHPPPGTNTMKVAGNAGSSDGAWSSNRVGSSIGLSSRAGPSHRTGSSTETGLSAEAWSSNKTGPNTGTEASAGTEARIQERTGEGAAAGSGQTIPTAAQEWSLEKPDLSFEGRSVPIPGQPDRGETHVSAMAPALQNEATKYELNEVTQVAADTTIAERTEPAETTEPAEPNETAKPVELRPPLPLTYAWQLVATQAKRFTSAA